MEILSRSVEETRALGAKTARACTRGEVYGLVGDLGTGKTEFVRGFTEQLKTTSAVRSPSFTLVNIYETTKCPVYHFDFYRLNDASELVEIGFDEYLYSDGVCLIEWVDIFLEHLEQEEIKVIRFAAQS